LTSTLPLSVPMAIGREDCLLKKMHKMSETLLQINNLKVGYRNVTKETVLFENLNLSLKADELVCFMGPNGSGKSTLIKTLANLTPALSIDSHREGQRIMKVNPKDISVVLTDRINALNMTVRELIAYGRYPYLNWSARLNPKDEKIIDEVIDKTHLASLENKNINELSDGQLQMVMIARALAQDTPVILLDEPTAHLDLNNRVEIMRMLKKLTREMNKAILVSTHELDLALQTADVLWLADGKNIRTGIPEDLVLDGSMDRVFQFKGFDLKSGKVAHDAHRGIKIKLSGEGSRYLWTKNALERSGYDIDNSSLIIIEVQDSRFKIQDSSATKEDLRLVDTVQELLYELQKIN
jgi:iron complex transport system ATP-binding protein